MIDKRAFILENTDLAQPPHVPEIWLYLASEAHDLWQKTEDELEEIGLPPPFWAFAWAGGQGLARFVLEHPRVVEGKRILDFASGSGIVGIAAMKAGAAEVVAADIDPFAEAAIALNAEVNGVTLGFCGDDLIGRDEGWDIILAGDVFYDKGFATALIPWFATLCNRGATVLAGDPGRAYLPKARLQPVATYQVPVTRALEDSEVKRTIVWRFT